MDRPLPWGQQEPEELLAKHGSARLFRSVFDAAEAESAMEQLTQRLTWSSHPITMFGHTRRQPRLVGFYGDDGVNYRYSQTSLTARGWVEPLLSIRDRCEALSAAKFNSVLANLYRDGTDSMGWHADDEPELGAQPTIASVSFGAARRFHLKHRSDKVTVKVVLEPGSVLVMSKHCQTHWQHQLPKVTNLGEPRINLTFRMVQNLTTRSNPTD